MASSYLLYLGNWHYPIRKIKSLDFLISTGITQNDLAEARTSQETKFFNEVRQLLEHGGNPNFQLLDNDATLVSFCNFYKIETPAILPEIKYALVLRHYG